MVMALTLAACSGGDDDGEFSPFGDAVGGDVSDDDEGGDESAGDASGGGGATGDSADLEAAAEAMFEAFVARDDDAWFDTLSRECRESLGFTAVRSYLDGRRFRISGAGIDLSAMSVSASTVASFDGSRGEVLLLLSGADAPFREEAEQTWIFEEGGWFLDECSDIEPADQLAGLGADRSAPAEVGFVVDADRSLVGLLDFNPDNADIVAELGGPGPVSGGTIATARVSVTYTGAEPTVRLGEILSFAFVAGDTVYGEETSCDGPEDGFFHPDRELTRGGSGPAFFVCREIDPGDANGLLLRVESLATGDDWWFTLG